MLGPFEQFDEEWDAPRLDDDPLAGIEGCEMPKRACSVVRHCNMRVREELHQQGDTIVISNKLLGTIAR